MTFTVRMRSATCSAILAAGVAAAGSTGLLLATAMPAGAATGTADVYVLHGIAGVEADIAVDSTVEKAAATASTVVGPLKVTPGQHTITVHPTDGSADLTATIDAVAGASLDVVAHSTADPTAPPVLTVFPNDMSAVAGDKARLVVAHTAAVPPADIRVNGAVLFSNIANGEALTTLVPGGKYVVDVVPTATAGPVVFGPVDLTVTVGALNRVFAFGNPEDKTMNAIVQVLPLTTTGSGAPGDVNTGNGGQAALSYADSSSHSSGRVLIALSIALAAVAAVLVRMRWVRGTRSASLR